MSAFMHIASCSQDVQGGKGWPGQAKAVCVRLEWGGALAPLAPSALVGPHPAHTVPATAGAARPGPPPRRGPGKRNVKKTEVGDGTVRAGQRWDGRVDESYWTGTWECPFLSTRLNILGETPSAAQSRKQLPWSGPAAWGAATG